MATKDDVITVLAYYGYAASDTDSGFIDYVIAKVENDVKTACNVTEIPEALQHAVIDRAVAELLFSKKSTGTLPEAFDFSAAISSIDEGDVSVEYAIDSGSKTPEQRFDELLETLKASGENQFAAFRRIKW